MLEFAFDTLFIKMGGKAKVLTGSSVCTLINEGIQNKIYLVAHSFTYIILY